GVSQEGAQLHATEVRDPRPQHRRASAVAGQQVRPESHQTVTTPRSSYTERLRAGAGRSSNHTAAVAATSGATSVGDRFLSHTVPPPPRIAGTAVPAARSSAGAGMWRSPVRMPVSSSCSLTPTRLENFTVPL